MVRDDLYITVPSFFQCPISLDVMKSPVSLCTGVTYDRTSIQRWIDNGNNTCPATMQVLCTKDFIPNLNLQRLIQIWSDSVQHRVHSPGSKAVTESDSVPSRDQVLAAVSDVEGHDRVDPFLKIVRFALDSDENRDFLAKVEGFVARLVGLLHNVDGGVEFLELVVKALDLVLEKIEDREWLNNSMLKKQSEGGRRCDCLDSLLLVLQQGSSDSRIASVRVLKSIAIDAESKQLIAEKEGIVSELLKIITPEKDPLLIENGLSCLITISTKRNKVKLVHLGAIRRFSKLLLESNLSVSIVEKVLKLLETMSSRKEGRVEICEEPECVAAILNKVMKISNVATEHAVTTLWSVCYLFRDQKAQEAVTNANGLTKILLLMQSNCSPSVRQMCSDLLKIFRVNSKSCLSCYDTKTTHIMPF